MAIDINEKKIVYGDNEMNKDIDTAFDEPMDGRSLRRAFRGSILLQSILHGGEGY